MLEHGLPHPYATKLLGRVIRRRHGDFPILRRTDGPGALTILHMLGSTDLGDYERRALDWAAAVWNSWSSQHDLIRAELLATLEIARA